ncbi:MAG: M42 family metallopeptidase [Anaerolineae bacterium]|jgi:endoglucanase|nr:M42 family metallopeptidase [Anaerolineae bacterium]MBT4309108.1 M42 family metallopeptidase [Anaerolineae bacterium]MBT4460151.1 M42 family metallopeptidase [Anaerolineae bacterium]MBT4843152.1 M42 family metallopeptidase [Anaerolineae bacterium]MBT6059806.1 M42 family metallopeptidase [Anaerolineae bacterium]
MSLNELPTLIKKLTETFSPSGYENTIRDLIMAEIKDFADEIHVDALGNLIARKGSGGKKIMLAAHMDEIGLIVNHVDKNGFARFTQLGTLLPHTLIGTKVHFLNGAYGVIGAEYLTQITKFIPIDKMFIDTGASSPKDSPVSIGDVGAIEHPFHDLGKRLIAKSMDNRVSVAALIETMRKLKTTPHEVYFVFTTQEETKVRGALTSAYGINPEIGIAIDICPTGDTPYSATKEISLGKGPSIKIKDPFMIADPRIVKWMIKSAEKAKIPYQREVSNLGSTDARAIQIAREGALAGGISIPCRYVHSPSEMVDLDDIQNTIKLLVTLLEKKIEL